MQREGLKGTQEQIIERENLMRERIKALFSCDMKQENPIKQALACGKTKFKTYSILTAHYCTEAATESEQDWIRVIANISKLVSYKGMLLISVSNGLKRFRNYGDQKQAISSPIIDEQIIRTALSQAEMDIDTLKLSYLKASKKFPRPYKGTWLIAINKKQPN